MQPRSAWQLFGDAKVCGPNQCYPQAPYSVYGLGPRHILQRLQGARVRLLSHRDTNSHYRVGPSFLPPKDSFTQRAITLAASGNRVLAKLKGS